MPPDAGGFLFAQGKRLGAVKESVPGDDGFLKNTAMIGQIQTWVADFFFEAAALPVAGAGYAGKGNDVCGHGGHLALRQGRTGSSPLPVYVDCWGNVYRLSSLDSVPYGHKSMPPSSTYRSVAPSPASLQAMVWASLALAQTSTRGVKRGTSS